MEHQLNFIDNDKMQQFDIIIDISLPGENLFENAFLDIEESNYKMIFENMTSKIQRYRLIEIKENFGGSTLYFLYCKKTNIHFCGSYSILSKKMLVWNQITKYKLVISQNYIRVNLDDMKTQYNVYIPLLEGNNDMILKSNMTPIIHEITKCDKDWREYCEELNEEINKNKNYPIRKISHMREITDLIGSFL